MLCRSCFWHCATLAVVPSLIRRAVVLRWGTLGLLCNGETNMCVLADGSADGLPRGTRLEMYGRTAQLVKVRTEGKDFSSVSSEDLNAIGTVMEEAMAVVLSNSQQAAATILLSPHTSHKGVVAEWSITTQREEHKTTSPPLMENGVVFDSPIAAGPRVLRAARKMFIRLLMLEVEKKQEQQQRSPTGGVNPLAILDVSELDCSFSRVAVHIGVEGGLETERDFHVSYVPLNHTATAAADSNILSLLRLVAHPQGGPQADPLRLLQNRYFALGCYTIHSSLKRNAKESMSLQLAHVISKIHCGGTLLVSVLGGHHRYYIGQEKQRERNEREVDKGKETLLLLSEVKAVVAEALSRCGRWGFIIDEVLPAADCHDIAVSLVVSVN